MEKKTKVKKKIKFIDPSNDVLDYVLKHKSTKSGYKKIELKTSKDSSAWLENNRNIKVAELVDKDDIIKLRLKDKIDVSLDAVLLSELYLLLDEFMKDNDNFMTVYKRKEKKILV